ncbi:6,7-dimethyl-8-ribityllumazine synthase [Candidatus Uhrbacteria bacterium RIFCSPLOWO2_01_FULL_47_24]|uniref:6,7-dimethyl-8-ribityllumazine synthase n=1 Tax=Candidatus Uhrbacteria bacterium RIFCSPLOWO2_01_FULL_47_24 TaxID=1802401 RepID=A0A1F7UTE0_9BACT|nr:MAG: 6,7-dimethyl-8-ribityllumazine synthase [Candidatus Uhrbacteria bacterium RIFCSPHIGHO2_01_FULL_47_11]OGL67583.1 MAG: 6,7-dimethyl-8-ribityllumazine synthase [Candidatus Uhrbacteria bacterium RIFCSPHIGHO2_02_FULL_46_47]OGL75065.1 MAG: 6,7-dimethyl-8-ribityllumazine synthase [Candidatus Uhrbacteria bacterium RIFCSPHIGHO2_12_FULL_47_11]OGL80937.1 MAG: 6,7-dimethyl-8-ribityllumazine synthase [Candidatus Uhrbacteria bacterium RIFCSPLOWO2_01_FULL_47_24]OGL84272.1 MAG: 6,7-dimethyl-8-ribityllu
MKYAIIVAEFNKEITDGLLKGTLKAFKEAHVKQSQLKIVHVPGTWEIPFAAHMLGRTKKYAAIVTLGAVIKGETTHDFWINHAVFPALQEIVEEYMIPVTLGIITCNSEEQAIARSRNNKENRGYVAAKAAIAMSHLVL